VRIRKPAFTSSNIDTMNNEKNTPYATSYDGNVIEAVAVNDIDYNDLNVGPTTGMASSSRSLNRTASMSWPVVNEGMIIYQTIIYILIFYMT
jgi:hypothetical protein